MQQILRGSELFSELSEETLDRVGRLFRKVVFPAGQVICREGDPGDSMFFIRRGRVAVLRDMGWGERELGTMGENEVVGEMALISDETRSATVRTLEETECFELGNDSFDALLEQEPAFAQQVARYMTKRFSALTRRTSDELLGAYRALMFAIADLTDSRDPETGAHLERTRNHCTALAEKLSRRPRYRDAIDHGFLESIYHVSPLHDVGKVAIPDAILLKPGRLDTGEFAVMKTHTTAGAAAFAKVLEQSDTPLFRMAHRICLHHHERWDGSGYPAGLSGDAIPLEARIMSFADVYDALRCRRVYKPPMSKEETAGEIRRSAGAFFDPEMTEVFLDNLRIFEEIHDRYQD